MNEHCDAAVELLRWWSIWCRFSRGCCVAITLYEASTFVLVVGVGALAGIILRRTTGFVCVQEKVAVPVLDKDEIRDMPYSSRALDGRLQRKLVFLEKYHDMYGYRLSVCGFIDSWRSRELPGLIPPIAIPPTVSRVNDSLEITNHTTVPYTPNDGTETEVYLDFAGSAIPTRSLLQGIFEVSNGVVLANPHSTGPAASRTVNRMEQAQKRILDHFGAHPGSLYRGPAETTDLSHADSTIHPGYEILFTSGSTDALRIVAERFPWSVCNNKCCCASSMLVYPHNAHTSVIGMRGAALQRESKATFRCLPLDTLMNDIAQSADSDDGGLNARWKTNISPKNGTCQRCQLDPVKNLLVLPMECNFGGDRPDVELAFRTARSNGNAAPQSWYTVLDLAKAACTSSVNLCQLNPDFACVSFYKMFGEPTGLGCLFVKRSIIDILVPSRPDASSDVLRRGYFGGGSVDAVLAGADFEIRRSGLSSLSSFISGTSHFRGIVSLTAGFNELDRLGGMGAIHQHTTCLAKELVQRLKSLRHGNGRSVVTVYGAWSSFVASHSSNSPGPTVAFNVLRADGSFVGSNEIAKMAALHQPPIQLRVGCFCNPGACQEALRLTDQQIIAHFVEHGHACGDTIDIVNGLPTGAIRVSFGKDSIWEDMDTFVSFLETMFISSSGDVQGTATYDQDPSTMAIEKLYVFPIKSCAAQEVKCWEMDSSSGRLKYDREFAIVDSSGSAMRQQTFPKMVLLRPEINLDNGTMTVEAPGQEPLCLQLSDDNSFKCDFSVVKVCGSKCSGVVWGDLVVSEWFSRFLNTRCWLARISLEHDDTITDSARQTMRRDPQLAFANDHPLLVVSESTINKLNCILKSNGSREVCARQFRPNVVIRSLDINNVFAEDKMTCLRFVSQDVTLECTGRCARCSMVDIDPLNGENVHILRVLAGYRRFDGQITFGVYFRGNPKSNPNVGWVQIRKGDMLIGM